MATTIVENVRNSVTPWPIEKDVVGCACSIVWRCRGCVTRDCRWKCNCGSTSVKVRDGCSTREVLRRCHCGWNELGGASYCLIVRVRYASWCNGTEAFNCNDAIVCVIS